MNQSAAPQPSENLGLSTNNISNDPTNNYQNEIQSLLAAVKRFRESGQVEENDVVFAKEKVLPQLGYTSEQISQFTPNDVMIKLQQEADKKSLADQAPENQVAAQVKNLTDNLTNEIDNEIKRQLKEKEALENAQANIDTVLTEHENTLSSSKPRVGLFHTKSEHDELVNTPSVSQTNVPEEQHLASTDPLTSSIEVELNSLHEGDKIGEDWTLRRIMTTSFGNKKSPFFELVNQAGASWTLSPEEMREVLRSNIFSANQTSVGAIRGAATSTTPNLGFDRPVLTKNSIDLEPKTYDQTQVEVENPATNQSKQSNYEAANQPSQPEKIEKTQVPEPIVKKNPEPVRLSPKQIEFLNKIHADPNLWSIFITFSPAMWENFNSLYEGGNLNSIGIEAHPLLDKLASNDYFDLVEIKKDDSSSKILTTAGYNLSATTNDPEILAVHIIANHKLLSELATKMKTSGLAAANLPTTKGVIELALAAKNGNSEALFKLVEALNFLPVGSKFKVVKSSQIENLLKYFSN